MRTGPAGCRPPGRDTRAPVHDPPAVHMRGITKRFPGVLANDDVSLEIRRGEIHALLGENGAGKSTLMNILSGFYRPDGGEIRLDGRPVAFASPRAAIRLGLGMMHQQFMLVPTLTVTENVVLGTYVTGHVRLRYGHARGKVAELASRTGLRVDPDALVGRLSVGAQQKVEILKLLFRGARVLIMDEPTAVLAPQEVHDLFTALRDLARDGRGIVLVTHKLAEVMAVADRVTVLRSGRVVTTAMAASTTEAELAQLVIGRDLPATPAGTRGSGPGRARLSIERLRVVGDRGTPAVSSLSLAVAAGEIVGLAGVEGNGQAELVETLGGLRRAAAGVIAVDGIPLEPGRPRAHLRRGVAIIPDDRHRYGLLPGLSTAENAVLPRHDARPFARRGFVQWRAVLAFTRRVLALFDVRPPDPAARVETLSGGNQQKLLLARELSREPGVIVAAQPTRGLDIRAVDFIHRKLREARDGGAAVLLVSQDLDELLKLSDRIAVLYRGALAGEMSAGDASIDRIGRLMTTGTDDPPSTSHATP